MRSPPFGTWPGFGNRRRAQPGNRARTSLADSPARPESRRQALAPPRPARGAAPAALSKPVFADLAQRYQDESGANDASDRGAAYRAHLHRLPARRDRSHEPRVRRFRLPLLTLRLPPGTSNDQAEGRPAQPLPDRGAPAAVRARAG